MDWCDDRHGYNIIRVWSSSAGNGYNVIKLITSFKNISHGSDAFITHPLAKRYAAENMRLSCHFRSSYG